MPQDYGLGPAIPDYDGPYPALWHVRGNLDV